MSHSWRFRLSGLLKERVLGHYGIPYSSYGLEPGLVPFLTRGEPITLVDVGASSGSFAAGVLAHCGIRRALLAEPQPRRCRELEARFAGRPFTIRQCAVSERNGSTGMDILNFDYSSSLLPVLPDVGLIGQQLDLRVREHVEVTVRTLDDLLAEAGWTGEIGLLKIDTQGTELQVLKGAVGSLARVRLIWTEVSFRPMYEGSAVFSEIHGFLQQHGFRFHSLQEGFRATDRELLQGDALFLGPTV